MQPRTLFLVVFLSPGLAFAQQLVTFDQVVTITERGNGAGAFHYLIKPAPTEPASWTAPVDYSKGTAYVHLEVMEKPSKRNTAITICFDGNLEGYGCIGTGAYTDVGTYETVRVLPTATWQYGEIAWGRRRQEYHLVVKDPALGGTPGGRPASDYAPTKMRIVMTIVPPGSKYTPPEGVAAPATDAGAPADAAVAPDPAPPPAAVADAASPPAPADAAVAPEPSPAPPPALPPAPPPTRGGGPSTADPPPSSPPPSTPVDAPASGGCAVSGSGGGAGGMLLLAAALIGALARKRRRR